MNNFSKQIFILGCERSGSTWLSNIFDSHPNVDFYMEPFADYAEIFPGFPSRNIYLSDINKEAISFIQTNYMKMPNIKYAFFYKPEKSLGLKYLDLFLISKFRILGKILKVRTPLIMEQYNLLNLNNLNTPVYSHFKKQYNNPIQVTKELRLNFKIPILAKLFSDAVYLVCIRHPGAQIHSIMRLFNKGNLSELRKYLLLFFECIQNHSRFDKYHSIINKYSTNDFMSKLILWWFINYEVLIEDLKNHNLNYKIIYHENISEEPIIIAQQIFNFCAINFDEQVKKYVLYSSSSNKNYNFSAINTTRNSQEYYKQMINMIDYELKKKINYIFSECTFIDELQKYNDSYNEN